MKTYYDNDNNDLNDGNNDKKDDYNNDNNVKSQVDTTSVLGSALLIFQLLLQENCIFQQLLCDFQIIETSAICEETNLDSSQMWSGTLQSLNSPGGNL